MQEFWPGRKKAMLVLPWVLYLLEISHVQAQIMTLATNWAMHFVFSTTTNCIQVDSNATGFTAAVICPLGRSCGKGRFGSVWQQPWTSCPVHKNSLNLALKGKSWAKEEVRKCQLWHCASKVWKGVLLGSPEVSLSIHNWDGSWS